ncbi:MAG TPA: ABC transporter permease [Chitinophagaceae bacterium]|nr:ABC transporter permease [Chitinophagaceae bacterium]
MSEKPLHWDWEITKKTSWLGLSFRELASYKDLLFRLVRKDFLASYQQTLLGPFWVVVQPLLTVFTYVLVFNRVIGISTEGIPPFLYYLTGITLWSLFSDIFFGTSSTFIQNVQVFSKVYFPRLIVPASIVLLHALRFLFQLLLLIVVLLYYYFTGQIELQPVNLFLALPAVVTVIGIGFGGGLLFSILTAKYRDLLSMMQLLIRLLMFLCPIFYSLARVPAKFKTMVSINPLASQFELFRFAFLGKGDVTPAFILYSVCVMLVLVAGGILLFNKTGDKLIDVL